MKDSSVTASHVSAPGAAEEEFAGRSGSWGASWSLTANASASRGVRTGGGNAGKAPSTRGDAALLRTRRPMGPGSSASTDPAQAPTIAHVHLGDPSGRYLDHLLRGDLPLGLDGDRHPSAARSASRRKGPARGHGVVAGPLGSGRSAYLAAGTARRRVAGTPPPAGRTWRPMTHIQPAPSALPVV
jgi:hypothetical protein